MIKKLVLILSILFPMSAASVEWSGRVVGISDGDTMTVLNKQNQPIKIRMVEIDAPEKNQDFGQRSKQSLSDLCFGKAAKVEDRGQDKYHRTLGRVYCDGTDANAEQVRLGMAWAYRQYLTDPTIADLEQEAKSAKAGLWGDANPTPPWEFRHNSHKSTPVSRELGEYHTGPRGGCYTLSASGKKRYVDHSFCR